jgi:hypothetical protein
VGLGVNPPVLAAMARFGRLHGDWPVFEVGDRGEAVPWAAVQGASVAVVEDLAWWSPGWQWTRHTQYGHFLPSTYLACQRDIHEGEATG